ncbi:MAG TPA: hypothetical protein VM557_07850 [Thermoanaerobaculia bacterium]|nr:hypothetical protein [Thermoanaerobaculia bacterium]
MSKLLFTFLFVLCACASIPDDHAEDDAPAEGESPAVAIELELRRLVESRGTLWPGFDPLSIPLAISDGARTFLFRHPSPPDGFSPSDAASTAHVMEGRHEAITANTAVEIGGVLTATLLLDSRRPLDSVTDLAATAVHEAFHADQRANHPSWGANEADLFVYPTDDAELLALRRMETAALRWALAAGESEESRCWSRTALQLRKERYERMDDPFAAYERGTELNEGLATWVEMKAAGRTDLDLSTTFGPAEIRRRAYSTGPALALLLDRFSAKWEAELDSSSAASLDEALLIAAGTGPACALPEDLIARLRREAVADVDDLIAERVRRLHAFEQATGWRIVVDAGSGEPLWPQGFDPLNVERLEPARVLHSRFLRAGNGAGVLEILNARALTEGVGPHPLFQGFRRVVVTGLPEPVVTQEGETVSVRAPGVTLDFKNSSVSRNGEVITVRLGS